MLRCPKCGNTYTDETLRFCLADGTGLVPIQAGSDIQTERRAKVPARFKILLGVIATVAVFGSVAMVALLIYINKNSVRQRQVPATPNVTSTPAAEKEQPQNSPPEQPKKPGEIFAKVDSPRDGFVALLAVPDAGPGEPLARIPHGTTIKLGYCLPQGTRVSKRDGRWCTTSYDGKTGWVFDAWLDRRN